MGRRLRIVKSSYLRWDEAHFGKFGSHYLMRTFYFDVHPPLGKMIVGLVGWLVGYNGSFGFDSGVKYPPEVPYVRMRMLLAAFGALLPHYVYQACLNLGLSQQISLLTGFLIVLETGLIGISRLILLDSMLIFFSTLAICNFVAFKKESKKRTFSYVWWKELIKTGIAIGCVSSVKWVGLFVTALIGVCTIEDLIELIRKRKIRSFAKHFAARAFGLIIVPCKIYIFSFWLHFQILSRSGPGDGNMSSLFQARLEGSKLMNAPAIVHYNSKITLKSNVRGGGLLHSHIQKYPEGSRQQQITTYHHKDNNNQWIILPADAKNFGEVMDGDIIKLKHLHTGSMLHSHSTYKAPISKNDFEVTGYGNVESKDANNLWKIEIEHDLRKTQKRSLKPLTTVFRLRHVETGCLLRSKNLSLPQWGFKQGEVSCSIRAGKKDNDILWNVEEHANASRMKPFFSS